MHHNRKFSAHPKGKKGPKQVFCITPVQANNALVTTYRADDISAVQWFYFEELIAQIEGLKIEAALAWVAMGEDYTYEGLLDDEPF